MHHPIKDKIFRNIVQWNYFNANILNKIIMILNKGIYKILVFISWKLQPLHLNSQKQNGMNSHSQQHYIFVPVFSFQPWRWQTSCHSRWSMSYFIFHLKFASVDFFLSYDLVVYISFLNFLFGKYGFWYNISIHQVLLQKLKNWKSFRVYCGEINDQFIHCSCSFKKVI